MSMKKKASKCNLACMQSEKCTLLLCPAHNRRDIKRCSDP